MSWMGLAFLFCTMGTNPHSDLTSAVSVSNNEVTIAGGKYVLGTNIVTIKEFAQFSVPDNPAVHVIHESVKMNYVGAPISPNRGVKLKGPRAANINARNSLVADSLVLTKADGTPLTEGIDYLLAADHALLGIADGSSIMTGEVVFADYSYRVLRLDLISLNEAGILNYTQGVAHPATPKLPEPGPGMIPLINVYRPYNSVEVKMEDLFPIGAEADIPGGTTSGLVEKTLAKLRAGEHVTVVCWGDSVTAGADVADENDIYFNRFSRMMTNAFPHADMEFHNISVGGTTSPRWVNNISTNIRFERVLELNPDLVTMEFVNDCGIGTNVLINYYNTILTTLRAQDAELIIIAPHFTHPESMGIQDIRTVDVRPYTKFVKAFTSANQVALADASSRWANLWRQGLPYVTLLNNSWNHPDGRGHLFFAEELMKCLE